MIEKKVVTFSYNMSQHYLEFIEMKILDIKSNEVMNKIKFFLNNLNNKISYHSQLIRHKMQDRSKPMK